MGSANNDKFVSVAIYVYILLGMTHLIVGFLAIEFLELTVTAFIYSFFFLTIGFSLLKFKKRDELENTKMIIILASTIAVLNAYCSLSQLITCNFNNIFLLPVFILFNFGLDLLVFSIFFNYKTKVDEMDNVEKISYFSIVITRGLGLGLLFQILAWLLLSPNVIMISYILLFGSVNMLFGQLFYFKKENRNLQKLGFFFLILGAIFGVYVLMLYPNYTFIVFTILYAIVIPIRFFYLFKFRMQ